MLNSDKIREDFPILSKEVNGKPMIYADNAASTQKPKSVIDAISNYYKSINSNVHRGIHFLSIKATEKFENTRKNIQKFINAKSPKEIIFTKGTTEGINLVANCMDKFIKENDEILISSLEHHSNIVPWQMLSKRTNAKISVIPLNENQEITIDNLKSKINKKTKLIAITSISNSIGVIVPIDKIVKEVRNISKAWILIDAAQAVSHMKIDVQSLGIDFCVFSAHKVYGTTGLGVLYSKEKILNSFDPYQGGGEMIKEVDFHKTTFNSLPYKFEAGTPNIEAVIALDTALKYINTIGLDKIIEYENSLTEYAHSHLSKIKDIIIYGKSKEKAPIISFNIKDINCHDLGFILSKMGIALRTGHHCTQPLMKILNIDGTVRVSLCFYNTKNEIDILCNVIETAKNMLLK